MADNTLFQFQVISPDRIFLEDEVDMIEVSTTEGDIGILKGHIPLTAILEPGILIITKGGQVKKAALHSGFIKILGNKVTILAESCEWPDEIDVNRAMEAKIRAERRLSSNSGDINEIRARMALRRSLVRIELTNK